MNINPEILEVLACPQDKSPLSLADASKLAELNNKIAAGELKNLKGDVIKEKLEAALIRQDQKFAYAIRGDIMHLLSEDAIPL